MQTWTDDRMDDREVRREMAGVASSSRCEGNSSRPEVHRRVRFDAFDRRFDLLLGTMVTGFVGLVVSHFLG